MTVTGVLAQNKKGVVEVLYFKANLACCKAKACNVLENDVKAIVEKNFTDGSVIFKEVKLADDTNKVLVEKYKAESQTVIIVKKKKKKETSVDATEIVKAFLKSQDKDALEKELLAKISELQKAK
ncbi:MAG: hypothetical protein CVU05_14820 [Bacteroidetes bacterium HGW-Bacteroidetes-21]|nr:MAG: hypothetical protein CVU05_14820 [Bacteroidetes bacterium HGW-Bacteroidetes-21]